MRRLIRRVSMALLPIVGAACAGRGSGPSLSEAVIMRAEDARAERAEDLEALLGGLGSSSTRIQQVAVRALGRLERPSLVESMIPLLTADAPSVRVEAVTALGQAVQRSGEDGGPPPELHTVSDVLHDRLDLENDPIVRGTIAATLGRLRYRDDAERRRAEAALGRLLSLNDRTSLAERFGAAKGLESLVRTGGKAFEPTRETVRRLGAALAAPRVGAPREEEGRSPRLRRLVMAALIGSGSIGVGVVEAALADPDTQVRRLGALAAGTPDLLSGRPGLIETALADPAAMVRYEALRVLGSAEPSTSCEKIMRATSDPDDQVALLAIDLIADACPVSDEALSRLSRLLDPVLPDHATAWHRPSHALVSLARLAGERGVDRITRYARHPRWHVRMYAARAAVEADLATVLVELARDDHHNVRQAALSGLAARNHPEVEALAVEALGGVDYQLVRTAALSLKGARSRSRAASALIAALERITTEGKETSRDARLAIVERLADLSTANPDELGGPEHQRALRPLLLDFDPTVAAGVADLLTTWTGRPVTASSPVPRGSASTIDPDAHSVQRATIFIEGLGQFVLRLLGDEAPASVTRFVQLARAGYYDGLTFHRVVPNFVIQGGSPGANEYAGDGPYMRDEVGRPHVRGAVGISTRGRDTGDAQIFIDLVDNPRLDHQYTVFAEVVEGMEVVDRVLEGAVIERIALT